METQGFLSEQSLSDLFSEISSRGLSGVLEVGRADVRRSFFVEGALLIGSGSSEGPEQLSQYLLWNEFLSKEQLVLAYKNTGQEKARLGPYLLRENILKKDELLALLAIKLDEGMCDTLSWTEGHFSFKEQEHLLSEIRLEVNADRCLELAAIRAANYQHARRSIPDLSRRYWVRDHFVIHSEDASTISYRKQVSLYACVERGATVNEMILEHNGRRFEVVQQLALWSKAGAIYEERRTRSRDATGEEPTRDELMSAISLIRQKDDFTQTLQAVRRALKLHPADPEFMKEHLSAERALFARLSSRLLASYRVPQRCVAIEAIEAGSLSDNEMVLYRRIDGHWDTFSLMNFVPMKDLDALVAIQGLLDKKMIVLS